ncbi:hypothetical protein [Marinobacter zhejiangensis]|uniref:Uncharacterized protein n=1 Tax=Marinobacter zhejiangensis TaxID=488535 RepID=A0A1I4T3J5_9GAMM|nr:hypothetical protein [Marinobacter zhejiangensis]SFM71324.1 hypothetical protein SAMN04487963_3478 [Marinobacter zhejiangensis]
MSLFLKVKISPEARSRFLSSDIPSPGIYKDWLNWLEGKEYSGSRITEKDIQDIGYGICKTVGDYFQVWSEDVHLEGCKEVYDPGSNVWKIYRLGGGHNYIDLVRDLSVLRSVCRYVDEESTCGYLVEYNYFFGADSKKDTAIELLGNESSILDEVSPEFYREANEHLEVWEKAFFESEFCSES